MEVLVTNESFGNVIRFIMYKLLNIKKAAARFACVAAFRNCKQ